MKSYVDIQNHIPVCTIFLGGNSVSDIANQHLSPSFKSMPTVYKEEVGDTAVLLCKVNNLGKQFTKSYVF